MDRELTTAQQSWRGATYDQVVAAWGPPARSAGNSHTWLSEDRGAQAPQRSGTGVGGVVFGPSSDKVARCERTLVMREGRVVNEDWSGDAEFCKRFARRTR